MSLRGEKLQAERRKRQMKRFLFLAMSFVLVILFFHAQPGFAQTSKEINALKDEVKSLKEGQTAIQKDLQEIKTLLQARQAPPAPPPFKEAIVSIEGGHVKGSKDAKLVMIEFSEYQ
jgi:hypothetical protein